MELRDVNTDGSPYTVPSYCTTSAVTWDAGRGTVFASRDGSALVFVSDATIDDRVLENPVFQVTGYLYFPDGTTYRIINSDVAWIRDRNGNKITFAYNSTNQVTSIVDQNGRLTTITYANTSCSSSAAQSCDLIGYTGWLGAESVEIGGSDSISHLRNGYSPESLGYLFPQTVSASNQEKGTFDASVYSYIKFPDESFMSFQYNDYAEIARVTLPTGGAIEYDWGGIGSTGDDGFIGQANASSPGAIVRRVFARREYPDTAGESEGTTTAYSYQDTNAQDGTPRLITTEAVTFGSGQTLQSQTVHTYWGNGYDALLYTGITYANWQEGKELTTAEGSPTLKTLTNTWQESGSVAWCNQSKGAPYSCTTSTGTGYPDDVSHVTQTSTLLNDTGIQSRVNFAYDSTDTNANNISSKSEYGWGATSPFRQTLYTYNYINQATSSCSNPCAYLVHLPASVTVEDGQGNVFSRDSYQYDQASLTGYSSAPTGMDVNYTSSFVKRGNITTHQQLLSTSQGSSTIQSAYTYDVAGNVLSAKDPNGNVTTYGYADHFSDSSGKNTYAFLTSESDALHHTQSWEYEYNSGEMEEATDQNGFNAVYSFGDPLDRLVQVRKAAGTSAETQTNIIYKSPIDMVSYGDQCSKGDEVLSNEILYDGFGRTAESRQSEGSKACTRGSSYIVTDTTYGALGRKASASNPYRSTSDPTYGITSYAYDTLGRTTKSQTSDGASTTIVYSGNQTTVTDQGGCQRSSVTDSAARLIQVTEDPKSSSSCNGNSSSSHAALATLYTYDPLDDLTTVNQSGSPRSFAYDSLKRLLSANNPESGTVAYSYDSVGNLIKKTDATQRITCYGTLSGSSCASGYDALNRVIKKTYSDGTPSVSYTYDTGATNGIGHLTSVVNSSSTSAYSSFDPIGRTTGSAQTTAGYKYTFQYSYNLAGSISSMIYPHGGVLTITYDSANRPYSTTGNLPPHTTQYIQQAAYWPQGAVEYYVRGNNVWHAIGYNTRLQPTETYDSLNNANSVTNMYQISCWNWGVQPNYGSRLYGLCPVSSSTTDNGRLQGASYLQGDPSFSQYLRFSQTYSYDNLNRVTQGVEGSNWGRGFDYDSFGNMWLDPSTGRTFGIQPAGNAPESDVYNSKNQITGSNNYDGNGNQIAVNSASASYDAENHVINTTEPPSLGGTVDNYWYDGNGQRVVKTLNGTTVVYVYDAFGELDAEYTNASQITSPCSTPCYLTHDYLGSLRLVTDRRGNVVVARHDYLPYGEEIPAGTGGRSAQWGPSNDGNIPTRFTGQLRDQETGLDYFGARYYGGALGRWTSPDLVNLTDDRIVTPSNTINKYIYGGNNPLKYVDPDGRDITVFYEQGNPTGHIMLSAYNQQTGDFAFLSVGPQKHLDPAILSHPLEGVPGTSEFSLPQNLDDLRQNFASLTIQTSPEVAQQAIDAIRNGAGTGNWALFGNNCTSACAKVLKDIGLNPGSKALLPWTPDKLWNNLNLLYGKSTSGPKAFLANSLGGSNLFQGPYKNGADYGNPRYGMNTFDWLMLMLKAPVQGCVSVSDSASGSKFGGCN